MANYYNSNKTGAQIDSILDGVIDVNINPSGEPTDYFNAIKIGDTIYALVGAGTTGGNKLYKHNFTFMYGSVAISGTCINDRSAAYNLPFNLFNNLENFVTLQVAGATILSKVLGDNVVTVRYVNNVGLIASLNVTTAMSFTEYTISNY